MAPPDEVIDLLNLHRRQFMAVAKVAGATGHTVPTDTKSWSQIIVTVLTGIPGIARKKGADLADGSDVKAANFWDAIDRPRFNSVLKTGRLSATSRTPDDVTALDGMPYLFFVLWDHTPKEEKPRCRIWVVRTKEDKLFRRLAAGWYKDRKGKKTSPNFQLHPPLNQDHDRLNNTWGTLAYPLLFCAIYEPKDSTYRVVHYKPKVLKAGACREGATDMFAS